MTDAIPNPELRDLLFPDQTPAEARARFGAIEGVNELLDAAAAGNVAKARSILDRMVASGAETRVRLLGWSILRAAGAVPDPATASRARGVVIDMPVEGGLDTLAGWEDGRARYFNHAGPAIVVDAPNANVHEACHDLLVATQGLADHTDVIGGPRPEPPGFGGAAIWALTDGGIHVVSRSAASMSLNPLDGPILALGVRLMQRLIEQTRESG
jgi:hypothetical protein